MLHVPDDPVVVLVDFQTRLMPVIHEGSSVVTQAVRLARIAQILGVPVMGTEQIPRPVGPERTGDQGCARTPSSRTISTRARRVWSRPCRTGATASSSPVARRTCACCKQRSGCCAAAAKSRWSAMPWGRVGRSTGTRDRPARGGGVQIATVEMIGFEWLGSSRHPRFREVLRLINRESRRSCADGNSVSGAGCANLGMSAHWRRQVWQAGCRRSWRNPRRRATRRRIVRERLVATLRARDDSSR